MINLYIKFNGTVKVGFLRGNRGFLRGNRGFLRGNRGFLRGNR